MIPCRLVLVRGRVCFLTKIKHPISEHPNGVEIARERLTHLAHIFLDSKSYDRRLEGDTQSLRILEF